MFGPNDDLVRVGRAEEVGRRRVGVVPPVNRSLTRRERPAVVGVAGLEVARSRPRCSDRPPASRPDHPGRRSGVRRSRGAATGNVPGRRRRRTARADRAPRGRTGGTARKIPSTAFPWLIVEVYAPGPARRLPRMDCAGLVECGRVRAVRFVATGRCLQRISQQGARHDRCAHAPGLRRTRQVEMYDRARRSRCRAARTPTSGRGTKDTVYVDRGRGRSGLGHRRQRVRRPAHGLRAGDPRPCRRARRRLT